jgi:peptidoglycan/xylan/chitin deacetylase (PgdA/CDA1 family)
MLVIIAAGILVFLELEYKTAFLEIYLQGEWYVGGNEVALTFDDCPKEPYTSEILDILAEEDVKATFFVIGKRAEKHPEVVKRMSNDSHSVGNHGLTDKRPSLSSDDGTADGIIGTQNILEDITGNRPNLFRLPSGIPQRAIKNVVDKENLRIIFANILIQNERKKTSDELVTNVVKKTCPGSIVLLHGDHMSIVKALPDIISKLKEKELKFITLTL